MLSSHKCLVGPRRNAADTGAAFNVVKAVHSERQSRLLVHTKTAVTDPAWEVNDVGLEDVVLAYMGDDGSVTAGPLSLVGGGR